MAGALDSFVGVARGFLLLGGLGAASTYPWDDRMTAEVLEVCVRQMAGLAA